nr:hypothetical protein [Tanacetum cinerariifolium]
HPSDTKVFTMKMEILLEPTSNKLLVGTLPMLQPRSSEVKFINQAFNVKSLFEEIASPKNSQVKLKAITIKTILHEKLSINQECQDIKSNPSKDKDLDIKGDQRMETSTLGEIVSLEKLNKNVNVPVNAAKQSSHRAAALVSAARRVNTAASRPNVNDALPTTYSYFKAHSPLLDESHVLLKVPRNNNMYNFDLKNVVPVGGIENQMDHKVKTIRYDNRTEFKNRIINEFCKMKGIRREFSIAKTSQQNCVIERKNRTLIEASKTMLVDSKLPTTFWAEAVNTTCYVKNRVLVIKPHNKTPYELFLGYTINSKAFRVFNTRTRFVEENLHINFLEHKPNVARTGPDWMFDIDTLTIQAGKKTVPGPQYVLLPLLTSDSQGLKSSEDEVVNVAAKKSTEVLRKENGVQDPTKEGDKNDQEKDLRDQEEALRKQSEKEFERLFGQREAANTNSTNRLNTVSSLVNVVSSSFTTVDPRRERAQKNEFESMFGQDKDANSNRMFTPVSVVKSTYVNLGGSILVNAATPPNANLPTNPLMPDLEDTADL